MLVFNIFCITKRKLAIFGELENRLFDAFKNFKSSEYISNTNIKRTHRFGLDWAFV